MYVYRITQVNEDGFEIDLTWAQIKKRASELGLEVAPELKERFITSAQEYGGSKTIFEIADNLTQGNSVLDDSHIKEGVCVRLEKTDGTIKVYKHKSFEFKVLEGILKQNDDYVDAEEVS